jgi:hypothetical protein
MKHIKSISELYKSTYKKVADKYKEYHTGRTDAIIKHAEEQGASHPIEREWPYRFDFSNYKKFQPQAGDFKGYFFITGVQDNSRMVNKGYKSITVFLSSNWGTDLKIDLSWIVNNPNSWVKILISPTKVPGSNKFWSKAIKKELGSEIRFLFENRKDAHQFLSYLKKSYLPDLIEDENKSEADTHPNSLTSNLLEEFLSNITISNIWISTDDNRYFQPE